MIFPEWIIATAHAAGTGANLPTVDVLNGSPTVDHLANVISSLLLWLAWPIGLVSIFYTAYLLINSGGKPDAMEKAKKNITYLISGLGLIIFSVVILRAVLGFLFAS